MAEAALIFGLGCHLVKTASLCRLREAILSLESRFEIKLKIFNVYTVIFLDSK